MLQHTLPLAGAVAALLLAPTQDTPRPLGQEKLAGGGASCILAPGDLGGSAWTLTWDDSVDATLDSQEKRCEVVLDSIDGAVTGRFQGPVLGTERDCVFTGELADGGSLLILQQREPGYLCSYQLGATAGGWSGTWRDSRGRAGTAVVHRPPSGLEQ